MADYKLVPVEPTAEMVKAACDEEQRPLPMWTRMKAIYKAMLAAAPDHIADARKMVAPAVQGEPKIEPYDAGSLNDFGGGDVGWWHDYIRAELDRAYEFYLIQLSAAPQPALTAPTGGESDE